MDGFGFSAGEKEIIGLIGPNGAGKTTVFNCVIGELRQDSGQIIFNGKDISGYAVYERVKLGITRTYQIVRPFREMTVHGNIRIPMFPDAVKQVWGVKDYDGDIKKIAAETGLMEYLSKLPDELPAGALRRLELARALAKNPKVVLVDEVFAGLAQTEIAYISKLIKQKREDGITFIVIDHNLRALSAIVDRVVVMNFGKKIAEGPYEKMVEDEEVKRAYLGG